MKTAEQLIDEMSWRDRRKMLRPAWHCILAALFLPGLSIVVFAQDDKPAEKKILTIGDVMNITAVLNGIDEAPGPSAPRYKFPGYARMTMAHNVVAGRALFADYQAGYGTRCVEEGGRLVTTQQGGSACDGLDKDRREAFEAENARILGKPSYVELTHLKRDDLCVDRPDKTRPDCEQKNEIPISTLATLDPILEK